MREGEGWSVCGAPLGLGESIGFVGATLSDWCTTDPQIWIHPSVWMARGARTPPAPLFPSLDVDETASAFL
jgi:hypothetical protein